MGGMPSNAQRMDGVSGGPQELTAGAMMSKTGHPTIGRRRECSTSFGFGASVSVNIEFEGPDGMGRTRSRNSSASRSNYRPAQDPEQNPLWARNVMRTAALQSFGGAGLQRGRIILTNRNRLAARGGHGCSPKSRSMSTRVGTV